VIAGTGRRKIRMDMNKENSMCGVLVHLDG